MTRPGGCSYGGAGHISHFVISCHSSSLLLADAIVRDAKLITENVTCKAGAHFLQVLGYPLVGELLVLQQISRVPSWVRLPDH